MDSKYTKFPLQEALNATVQFPTLSCLRIPSVGEGGGMHATDKHKPPLPPNSFALITYTFVTSHINF